jgi:recombinational DNA repair ATPase RecF
MKITAIKTSNFLGARNVDAKLSKPICLFAGKNFSGKSSLQEALRMALTGESVRVSLKKDYRKLVTDGADVGFCVVEHDGQQSAITLPNGAHEHTGNTRPHAVLPYVLDAQRFSPLATRQHR